MKRFIVAALSVMVFSLFLQAAFQPALADQYAYLNQKMAIRTGPGTDYDEPGTFFINAWKNVEVRVLSRSENKTWALVEFEYKGNLLRAYTGFKRLNGVRPDQVPEEELIGTGYTDHAVTAYYGPGIQYMQMEHDVPGNTYCDVIVEENGYALVDYPYQQYETSRSRSWIPADRLIGYIPQNVVPDPYISDDKDSRWRSHIRYGQSWWDEEPEWSYAEVSYLNEDQLSVHMFFYRIADIYGTITLDDGNLGNHGFFTGHFDIAPDDPISGEAWFYDGGWAIDMNAKHVDDMTGAAYYGFPNNSVFLYYYR